MQLSLYTLVTRDYTLDESLEMAAVAGFDAVDIRMGRNDEDAIHLARAVSDAEVAEVRARVGEAGLHVSGLTSYWCLGYVDPSQYRPELEGLGRAFEIAAGLGARFLRCSGPRQDFGQSYEATRAAFRNQIEHLAETAAAARIVLTVEQHGLTLFASAGQIVDMLRGLEDPWVGIVYDPGNCLAEGWENPAVQVDMLSPYIKAVHIKNHRSKAFETAGPYLPNEAGRLDEGQIVWADLLARLHGFGYEGYLTLEDFYGGFATKQEQLNWDASYLRGLLAGLE